VARRRFGVTGRANQAAGGAAALGGATAASLHCQRGDSEGAHCQWQAASLSGWPRAAARAFFFGDSALLRGRLGPWRRGSCGHEGGSPTCQRRINLRQPTADSEPGPARGPGKAARA
jgi:hypothetical protein